MNLVYTQNVLPIRNTANDLYTIEANDQFSIDSSIKVIHVSSTTRIISLHFPITFFDIIVQVYIDKIVRMFYTFLFYIFYQMHVQCFLICYKKIFDVAIFELMENTFVKRKRVISHVVCSLEKFPPSLGTNLFHMSERMLE